MSQINLNKKRQVHNKWERQRGGGEEKEREAGRGIEYAHACVWKSLHCSLAAEVRKTERG